MIVKNVYFVLANKSYGKALYFPYASGCLAAYAWADEEIRSEYNLAGFIYKRDDIPDALEKMKDPAVVAFSCYLWTIEYNKLLARAVKEKYPDCLILFGGHEISRQSDLEAFPYVDVFTFGEGEIPFKKLLLALKNGDALTGVPNSAVRTEKGIVFTEKETYVALDYPSPYTTGVFDGIIAENPGVEFDVTIETNRGCPYMCAYCDWCYTPKVREFPMEKVRAEIDWCADHKVEYIYNADANFGILPRDYEIAEYAVEVSKRTGYPQIFNACYAKNSNDNVFKISKLLYDNKINKAITLAYQTVCDKALKNVNRTNFTMDAFADLVHRYNEYGIPTYTELIMGLPGETYESFCEGICRLIEAGQHNAMTVYGCQVFQNALMGSKAYREKFGIVTAHVKQGCVHSSPVPEGEIQEYTDLVIATKDMSFDDMIRSLMFCSCAQGFHHIGLLKFFAIYLRQEMNVPYLTFYKKLLRFVYESEGTFLNRLFRRFEAECRDLSHGEWTYIDSRFGDMGWYYDEGLFMEVASHYEEYWQEIQPFLHSFGIPEPLCGELCRYQKFVVRLTDQEHVSAHFDYDFTAYFLAALELESVPLQKRGNTVDVTVTHPVYDWHAYSRQVMLFGKKKSATLLVTDLLNDVKIIYDGEAAAPVQIKEQTPAETDAVVACLQARRKKNVYFVQVNDVYGSAGKRSAYLPYAVGCIQAYCMQDPAITSEYAFGRIVFLRDDISAIVARLKDPYMVLFSCSVWNTEFNKTLARAVKEAYPACYITFGGHHVSSDLSFLQNNPFVDFVIHNGGEEPAAALLKSLSSGAPLDKVSNLSYRLPDGGATTTPILPQEGSDYPSPYLTGVFDDLLSEDLDFSVIMETNRGCPNSCTFCDWGQLGGKVRLFPLERVFAEIDWIVKHKIEYVYCADANFCLFSRDEKIVDYVLKCNKEYGYPKIFHVNFTKNRTDFVFDISTRMVRGGLAKAQTIAFQSMDPQVLDYIGRKNMSPEHFRSLMRRFNENHIATYSELILGLPGETYESFCRGMCSLIENGQHFAVYVYPCEVFPNSEISQKSYREKYGIGTTRVPFLLMHSGAVPVPGAVTEYVELLTSTASMDRMDWARTYVFASFVQGLHNIGFSRALAMYLRNAHQFSYLSFYRDLLCAAAAHPESFLGGLYHKILALCVGVAEGKNAFMATCEDTNDVFWSFEEIVCIEIVRQLDRFYEELFLWCDSLFAGDPVLPELYRYQKSIIKKIGPDRAEISCAYDFYGYFESVYVGDPQPLKKTPVRISVQDSCPVDTLADYAREVIWYGRNRQMADYTGHYYDIRCEALPSDSESVS